MIKKIKSSKFIYSIKEFIYSQQVNGLILIVCTVISLIIANSLIGKYYFQFLSTELGFEYASIHLKESVLNWINDGLMAVFFLLVGLEIKREVVKGELSSFKKAILPVNAALGGMIVPALIFLLFNYNTPYRSGWGIPMATDIAFALGILSLIGNRVPISLKIFLTALAVIDDLGAVVVIAIFYTEQIDFNYLLISLLLWGFLLICNRVGIRILIVYIFIGIVLWYTMLQSGVHATVAGVLIALAIPIRSVHPKKSLAERLEHWLHKPVSYFIMPVFALVNTAIVIKSDFYNSYMTPLNLGIMLGLIVGKPIGIISFSYLSIKSRLATLPSHAKWKEIIGLGCLGGIGFTMSIFVSILAFTDSEFQTMSKIAILTGSIVSGWIGYQVLVKRKKNI